VRHRPKHNLWDRIFGRVSDDDAQFSSILGNVPKFVYIVSVFVPCRLCKPIRRTYIWPRSLKLQHSPLRAHQLKPSMPPSERAAAELFQLPINFCSAVASATAVDPPISRNHKNVLFGHVVPAQATYRGIQQHLPINGSYGLKPVQSDRR
jgi:hypothetical protein